MLVVIYIGTIFETETFRQKAVPLRARIIIRKVLSASATGFDQKRVYLSNTPRPCWVHVVAACN